MFTYIYATFLHSTPPPPTPYRPDFTLLHLRHRSSAGGLQSTQVSLSSQYPLLILRRSSAVVLSAVALSAVVLNAVVLSALVLSVVVVSVVLPSAVVLSAVVDSCFIHQIIPKTKA